MKTMLFFRSSPALNVYCRPLLAKMPPSLNMYEYPVTANKKARRTGVCVPQYCSLTSSDMESAVRSESPRNAKSRPMKAVAAEGLLNSRGVGYSLSGPLYNRGKYSGRMS